MGDTLGEIDLVEPDNYVERIPFEWFDHLRHEHPVVWHPEPEPNAGFWAVTRYDDLTAIHMDWQTGISTRSLPKTNPSSSPFMVIPG